MLSCDFVGKTTVCLCLDFLIWEHPVKYRLLGTDVKKSQTKK